MLLFTIWLKAFWQPRRFTFGWLVALKTGHAGTAAGTGVRTFPRLIGMCFANPALSSQRKQVTGIVQKI
jgi:hypothetical protein